MVRIAFIGWGAIAGRTAELVADTAGIEIAAVAVRDASRTRELPRGARLITRPEELAGLDLAMIVEAAGRPAVALWGEPALRAAGRFVVSSTSAFCDDALLERLIAVAAGTGSRIIVPPGALGGLGALSAAALLPLATVRHVIVKPPRAWAGTPAAEILDLDALEERRTFFSGSAREAASRFPQNANVAVISALSGIGLDRTEVELVADPAAVLNAHEVSASGDFGRLHLKIENAPLARNPKSSEMTALSLARLILNEVAPLAV